MSNDKYSVQETARRRDEVIRRGAIGPTNSFKMFPRLIKLGENWVCQINGRRHWYLLFPQYRGLEVFS